MTRSHDQLSLIENSRRNFIRRALAYLMVRRTTSPNVEQHEVIRAAVRPQVPGLPSYHELQNTIIGEVWRARRRHERGNAPNQPGAVDYPVIGVGSRQDRIGEPAGLIWPAPQAPQEPTPAPVSHKLNGPSPFEAVQQTVVAQAAPPVIGSQNRRHS